MTSTISDEAFTTYAALMGFDIQGFDKWLPKLQGTGAYTELTERREAAKVAASALNESELLRHLEWLLLRWKWITRADALAPLASFAAPFKTNAKGRGKSVIRKAIGKLLHKTPSMSNAQLWAALKAKPPKGWEFTESPRLGKFATGPKNENMEYSSFINRAADERRELKAAQKLKADR